MTLHSEITTAIDQRLAHFGQLESEYGLPRAGAIFDCFKLAQAADGSIPLEAELYIQEQLGRPLAEQRRLRSQYDMLSQGIPDGASGLASELLYERFLGDKGEGLSVRQRGPLLEGVGPDSHRLSRYLAQGGYQMAAKALSLLTPAEVIDEVKLSGLRGRGGAYFPVGVKWAAVAGAQAERKFLVCNADEGEPPTRKDKVLMDQNPHLLLEGMLLAGYAIGARLGIIYVRGDYQESMQRLAEAIEEAREANWLGQDIRGTGVDFEIEIFAGSGSYVAGCDTAMLESLEGKAAIPRATPPYPTQAGLDGMPTVVNNVETLCNVPVILRMGGEAYAQVGDPDCPGTKIFGLSGDIAQPGMYELPTGTPLRQIIDLAGGVVQQEKGSQAPAELKALSPGGVTTGLLTAEEVDRVTMDPGSLAEVGAFLGSGAIAVFNHKRDLRQYAEQVLNFLAEESCGSCLECPASIRMSQRIIDHTRSGPVSPEEIESINYRDKLLPVILKCGLGKARHVTVRSALNKFPDDFKPSNQNGRGG